MVRLLQDISKHALLLNEFDFTKEQMKFKWLGSEAATDAAIESAQKTLQIKLPKDYIEFLKISNGFPQCTITGVSFLPVNKVDYLINVEEDLVEAWAGSDGLDEVGQALSQSLLIGGLNEEQYFLLIPPSAKNKKWRYWKFATWMAGEEEFKSLKDYLRSELSDLKAQTKDLKKPKAKPTVDYSLLNYVFSLDWENVYKTSFIFLRNGNAANYFGGQVDLFRLILMAASRLDFLKQLEKDLNDFIEESSDEWLNEIVIRFIQAAQNGKGYHQDFQPNTFIPQEDMITAEELEEQTRINCSHLLKPKNIHAKINYQLYFYFKYGNAKEFIGLYEAHLDSPYFDSHLKAAIVYASLNDVLNAQNAVERYFKTAFRYRPLEPFLEQVLTDVMTKEFSNEMLLKFC